MFYLRRFCWPTFRISDNKFCICCHGDCLQRLMNIYFSYLLCLLLFSFMRCRKKVTQVLFCDLHSAVVLADNVWSSRQNYWPCVMVHRFCRPILSGNSTTPTKVCRLCRSSDIPFSTIILTITIVWTDTAQTMRRVFSVYMISEGISIVHFIHVGVFVAILNFVASGCQKAMPILVASGLWKSQDTNYNNSKFKKRWTLSKHQRCAWDRIGWDQDIGHFVQNKTNTWRLGLKPRLWSSQDFSWNIQWKPLSSRHYKCGKMSQMVF